MKRQWGRISHRLVCTSRLLFAVAILLAAAHCALAQTWQTFKYQADGFSAAFPSAPQVDSHQIDTPSGTVDMRSYTLDIDTVALYVGICDYGAKAQGSDVDAMLEGARNGALENSKAQLTRESKIMLGHHHGLEFESENEGMHYFARIYMVGATMYQTLVVYPIASPYADARRFLDSFQLLSHEPGHEPNKDQNKDQ